MLRNSELISTDIVGSQNQFIQTSAGVATFIIKTVIFSPQQ